MHGQGVGAPDDDDVQPQPLERDEDVVVREGVGRGGGRGLQALPGDEHLAGPEDGLREGEGQGPPQGLALRRPLVVEVREVGQEGVVQRREAVPFGAAHGVRGRIRLRRPVLRAAHGAVGRVAGEQPQAADAVVQLQDAVADVAREDAGGPGERHLGLRADAPDAQSDGEAQPEAVQRLHGPARARALPPLRPGGAGAGARGVRGLRGSVAPEGEGPEDAEQAAPQLREVVPRVDGEVQEGGEEGPEGAHGAGVEEDLEGGGGPGVAHDDDHEAQVQRRVEQQNAPEAAEAAEVQREEAPDEQLGGPGPRARGLALRPGARDKAVDEAVLEEPHRGAQRARRREPRGRGPQAVAGVRVRVRRGRRDGGPARARQAPQAEARGGQQHHGLGAGPVQPHALAEARRRHRRQHRPQPQDPDQVHGRGRPAGPAAAQPLQPPQQVVPPPHAQGQPREGQRHQDAADQEAVPRPDQPRVAVQQQVVEGQGQRQLGDLEGEHDPVPAHHHVVVLPLGALQAGAVVQRRGQGPGRCYTGEGGATRGRAVLHGGGRCYTGEGGATRGRAVLYRAGRCYTGEGGATRGRAVLHGGGRCYTGQGGATRGRVVLHGGGRCYTGEHRGYTCRGRGYTV